MIEMNFSKGMVTAIAQDVHSGEILMVAFMNQEAFDKTLETGKAHYFSRSRNSLWLKGESSGHFQYVKEVLVDCDMDAVVLKIEQEGAACHMGYRSCFFRRIEDGATVTIAEKVFDPDSVYGE